MNHLVIDLSQQVLHLYGAKKSLASYSISSAANGVGELLGSECTPRGLHIIRAKIGAKAKANTVFVGRRPTGEIYTPELRRQHPNRDWILTRILWLSGVERGKNRLGNTDSMRRYIYIHGTPDEVEMGVPGSRGCIRMRNTDMITLFDQVQAGARVALIDAPA